MIEKRVDRAGIVKIAVPNLGYMFGGECSVLQAAITDEDLRDGTISLVVADHVSLPEYKAGERLQEVTCTFTTSWAPENGDGFIRNSLPVLHPTFEIK